VTATPAERKARGLLSRHTPESIAAALRTLLDTDRRARGAEWYFLMGVCALGQGHLADAQAHLDHACTLATVEALSEYRTLYESVRNVFEKKRSADEDRGDRDHACCSAEDCCECCFCCDSDGDGICCEGPDGCCDCCDCSDGCN
jgi:hypothetical protein